MEEDIQYFLPTVMLRGTPCTFPNGKFPRVFSQLATFLILISQTATYQRIWVFDTNYDFPILKTLQPVFQDLWYFEIKIYTIRLQRYKEIENASLWQKLNSFFEISLAATSQVWSSSIAAPPPTSLF